MDKKYLDLSVNEKIALFNGLNAWQTRTFDSLEIEGARMSDGPHGIRREKPMEGEGGLAFIEGTSFKATCYPPACLSACSFDKNLLYKYGELLAKEARSLDVDLILGPGINIKRSPLCGRNFEYFSEDPYLSGTLGMYLVKGIQDNHVGACIKHYALNNQETNRLVSSSDAPIDVMQEIYLKPFEIAIKGANPYSIMCCYNKVNGVYGSENPYLLKEILRDKWQYKGMVVSDWGATNEVVDSFKNGLNLEMPGGDQGEIDALIEAYNNGEITIDEIHEATYPVYQFNKQAHEDRLHAATFNANEALELAKKVAEQSIVLAKNENILPLSDKRVLVVGELAAKMHYQGGGSSHINSTKIIQPLEALKENVDVEYLPVYDVEDDSLSTSKLDEAKQKAKLYDKVICFIGTLESEDSEGYDRNNMNMRSYMVDLINAIYEVNKNIVCVIQCGAPLDLSGINEKCKAILISYMPGCMGGEAISNILLGKVNPSGRLAETWPLNLESTYHGSSYPCLSKDVLYTEGFYVGYRYYNFAKKDVLFPFGHGLTYSDIQYSSFHYEDRKIKFKVTNNSANDVKEVIQLYISHSSNPLYKELKYFDKVEIKCNSTINISININEEMLEYYDYENDVFSLANGTYYIHVAKNAKEDYFKTEFVVESSFELKQREIDIAIPYTKEDNYNRKGKYTLNTKIIDINNSFIGRIVYKVIIKELKKQTKGDEKAFKAMKLQVDCIPIRGMLLSPGSLNMSRKFLLGLVDIINGHIIRGVKKMK